LSFIREIYCDAKSATEASEELQKLKDAVRRAGELGLKICAGHGLNYDNTARVVREIPDIVEYNIGHSIVSRALFVGLERAVQEMNEIIKGVTL
jgi:pyridoxine 5-phosphate synthase